MNPTVVDVPPEEFRYSGDRQGAERMRDQIETNEEVAVHVLECDGIYYTVEASPDA